MAKSRQPELLPDTAFVIGHKHRRTTGASGHGAIAAAILPIGMEFPIAGLIGGRRPAHVTVVWSNLQLPPDIQGAASIVSHLIEPQIAHCAGSRCRLGVGLQAGLHPPTDRLETRLFFISAVVDVGDGMIHTANLNMKALGNLYVSLEFTPGKGTSSARP